MLRTIRGTNVVARRNKLLTTLRGKRSMESPELVLPLQAPYNYHNHIQLPQPHTFTATTYNYCNHIQRTQLQECQIQYRPTSKENIVPTVRTQSAQFIQVCVLEVMHQAVASPILLEAMAKRAMRFIGRCRAAPASSSGRPKNDAFQQQIETGHYLWHNQSPSGYSGH